MNATRSWNTAIVTLGLVLAAFLASVIASSCGWHPAITERTAGASGLAMIGCGLWLYLSARRFGPLEPEDDDDMRPGCPYGCDHGDQGDAS